MIKRTLAGALTGLLLVLATAPVGLWWLGWVAFLPLFFAIDGHSAGEESGAREGRLNALFITGFAAGFVYFLGTIYWVVNSMYHYGGVPIFLSVPIMLALCAYLALYPAFFSILFKAVLLRVPSVVSSPGESTGSCPFLNPGSFRPVRTLLIVLFSLVVAPGLWVATEFLRGTLLTGFPWTLLGYTQTPNILLIQIVDITGVWGVSYVIIAFNAALFMFLRGFVSRNRQGASGTLPAIGGLVIVLFIISGALVYGTFRIGQIDGEVSEWKSLRVGVAQGNIGQALKWGESYRQRTLDIYSRLSRKAQQQGARLVVWPETAVPFYLGEQNPKQDRIIEIVDNAELFVLTGAPSYDYNPDTKDVEYLNSAYLFAPSRPERGEQSLEGGVTNGGSIAGRYDKVHLVPYGEYVPLKRFFPFIKKLTVGVGDFSSGPGSTPIPFEETPLGLVICYEVIFPTLSAVTVEAGAGLLVNLTNDAWFGRSSAPYQHFEMALFRAVENRIFLVRSANTGISAVVDPVGRVVAKSQLFEEELLVHDVAIKEGRLSFYTRHPDLLAYLSVGLLLSTLLYLIISMMIRRRF